MIALSDLNLTTPFKLIHPDLTSIEIVTDLNYLNYQTTLGVKDKSLENCIIEDVSNNQFYKIIDIIVLGKKNPWWMFEFFNPILKVNLVFEKIEDSLCLKKLLKLSIISNKEILEGKY
jgi:hypothetical protein